MTSKKLPGRIMIVDDQEELLVYMDKKLSAMGYIVETAISIENIFQKLISFEPHMIIMDIDLNENLDGIDISEQLQEYRETFVIFLTGHVGPKYRIKAENVKHVTYMEKPCDLNKLDKIIQRYLTRRTEIEF